MTRTCFEPGSPPWVNDARSRLIRSGSLLLRRLLLVLFCVCGYYSELAPPAAGATSDQPSIRIRPLSVFENTPGGVAEWPVNLSVPSDVAVSVQYRTRDLTASAGLDYLATNGTLTFPPGSTQAVLRVQVLNDNLFEGSETFRVEFSNPVNAVLSTNAAVVTLLDDDPVPLINVGPARVAEGQTLALPLSLSGPSAQPVTLRYTTVSGSALAVSDYTPISANAFFAPGQTNQTILIPTRNDAVPEGDEYFDLVLSNPSGAIIGNASARVTIVDDDAPPAVQVLDAAAPEGNAGENPTLRFPVKLSRAVTNTVEVSYLTVGGSATLGVDFKTTSGTLRFEPGATGGEVQVVINGDDLPEPNETFTLILTNAVNAAIARSTATGTIVNDDGVFLEINNATVQESDGLDALANFTVTLLGAPAGPVSVKYATRDGTARAGLDYRATNGTLSFGPGEKTATISVRVIGDIEDEPDEAFEVQLTSPAGAELLPSRERGIATIIDNDPALINVSGLPSIPEGTTNASYARFTVSLTAPSPEEVRVSYFTADDTATAGLDYLPAAGELVFPPGTTNRFVDVVILGDALYEPDEKFLLVLTNAVNGRIKSGIALGRIKDDDMPPQAAVSSAIVGECVNGSSIASVIVSLSEPSAQPARVYYSTHDLSATAGLDYLGVTNGVLNFPPGTTETTLRIELVCDLLDEPAEQFAVQLIAAEGALIDPGASEGVVTILDDDPPALTISDAAVTEGAPGETARCEFILSLSSPSTEPVSVGFSTEDLSATAAIDYTAVSGRIVFQPGETIKNIQVPIVGDALPEEDETFQITLDSPVNATLARASATGTILDDDQPAIQVTDATVVEGDNTAVSGVFVLSLSRTSSVPVSVRCSTRPGTALPDFDFLMVTNTVVFPPGELRAEVSVPVLPDTFVEAPETVFLELTNPRHATLERAEALLTILDNDGAPIISASDVSVPEGNGPTNIPVTFTLSKPVGYPVRFTVLTANGSANAPGDFLPLTTNVTFAPGQTNQTVQLAIIGDNIYEADEEFYLRLSNPTSGIFLRDQIRIRILNDDEQPALSIRDASVVEGKAGTTTNVYFLVLLSEQSSLPVSVAWRTIGGTASPDIDFAATNGVLIFPPGSTRQIVDVTIIGDDITELDETFSVELSNPAGARIMGSSGTGTIINDDGIALQILDASAAEPEAGQIEMLVPVRLGRPVSQPVSASYETIPGTASEPDDYYPAAGTITFPPGSTEQFIRVFIRHDGIDEPNETFSVRLFNAVNATIVRPKCIATILDSDPPAVSIDDVVINGAAATQAVFHVTLSNPHQDAVSVRYATANGTATAPSDYIGASGILVFSPGQTNKTISVPIQANAPAELEEFFYVELSPVTNATPGKIRGTGTIQNIQRLPPEIVINQPLDESIVTNDNAVVVSANAEDRDGQVVRVTFYNGELLLGFATNAPWQIVWANPPAGDHLIHAVALDNAGLISTSAPVHLHVRLRNQPPAISPVADQISVEDQPAGPFILNISDDHTAPEQLRVSIESSNPGLLPNTNIALDLVAGKFRFTATPRTNQFGSTVITVTAQDEAGLTARQTFLLTVQPVNDLPFISPVSDQDWTQGALPPPISFSVSDVETAADALRITVASSNPDVLPVASTVLSGTGSERTIALTSPPAAPGRSTITLTVEDAEGGRAQTSFLVNIGAASTNQPPAIRLVQPLDRSVFPFGETENIRIEAAAPENSGIKKVEFFVGTTSLGEALSAPWAVDWPNPGIGDYILTAVATDIQGGTSTASARIAVAEICGTVALVCHPANPEIPALLDNLFEIGLKPDVIDRTGATSFALNNYDLIIWHEASNLPLTAAELSALKDAADEGRAIYFISDDLPEKASQLSVTAQNDWADLIHLRAAGSTANPAAQIELFPLSTSDWPYLILNEGKAGTVASFRYPFSRTNWRATGEDGEFVIGWAGDSDVLVASLNDLNAGSRRISQAFQTFTGGDSASVEQRKILFQNAVWWLMRCVPCNNLNLSPHIYQTSVAPGHWSFDINIHHNGRCEAAGVSLTVRIPPGLELEGASTQLGRWQRKGNDLVFIIGRQAPESSVGIQFTISGSIPGTYTNQVILRSSSEAGGALDDNEVPIVVTVPGLSLRIADAVHLQITGAPEDGPFIIEQSNDLKLWTPVSTGQLSGGSAVYPIPAATAARSFFRARFPE